RNCSLIRVPGGISPLTMAACKRRKAPSESVVVAAASTESVNCIQPCYVQMEKAPLLRAIVPASTTDCQQSENSGYVAQQLGKELRALCAGLLACYYRTRPTLPFPTDPWNGAAV